MFGKKKSKIDGLFAELEDIKDARGNLLNTVLFSSPELLPGSEYTVSTGTAGVNVTA